MMDGTERPALSFDGSSEFVLTYEDKEGDWMLVGDVHWEYVVINSLYHIILLRLRLCCANYL